MQLLPSWSLGYPEPGAICLSVCLSVYHRDADAQNLRGFLLPPQNSSFLPNCWTLHHVPNPSLGGAVKWAITKIQLLGCGLNFSKAFVVLIKWICFHMNIFRNSCAWMHVVRVCIKLSVVLTGRRRKRSYSLKQSLNYCILYRNSGTLGEKNTIFTQLKTP